jgi:pimeloyl-ACP methyl ester carboxylesterase
MTCVHASRPRAGPKRSPRNWAEEAYPNLIYFNEADKGGHFAAWEQPELFSAELRAGFRSLRA